MNLDCVNILTAHDFAHAQTKHDVLILDVREEESYELGHIEPSVNLPKSEHKWPTLPRNEIRNAVQTQICVVIDEGGNGDGFEVAHLLLQILKKHCGICLLKGGMRAYVSLDFEPRLPFEGEVLPMPVSESPRIRTKELQFTQDETPIEEARIEKITEVASEAFGASIEDLQKELKYDYSLLSREIKRLRMHGMAPITDTGIRYRVFCAYEGSELVGFLVLKHSKIDVNVKSMWAVVKYVCGLRRGVGFALQRQAWHFCRYTLGVTRIHAGAWLEFPHAWISHVRWGYRFHPIKDWPKEACSPYGSGVLSMCKELPVC